MPELSGIPIEGVGWGALIFLVVLALIRGDIVPRKTYESMVADRDYWRAVAEKKDETIHLLSTTTRTSAAVLEALPKADGQ